jgi:hypothetical protein
MSGTYFRTVGAILAVVAAVGLGTAHSQEQPSSQGTITHGMTETAPSTSAVQPPRTLFTIFGLPVHIGAPVAQPYSGSAYQTFAGQPMRSGEAVLAPNLNHPGP